MIRSLAVAAALPLGALLAGPAAAAPFFTFEIEGTFQNVTINGVAIDQPFVISGRSTTALSDTPWDVNTITAPLDLDSVSLSYGGAVVAIVIDDSFWTYGLVGADVQTTMPPHLSFRRDPSTDTIDVMAATVTDSFGFAFDLAGTPTWLGFGGASGRNLGLTIVQRDGVVQYGDSDIAGRLLAAQNMRSVDLVGQGVAPIPLPAAGWLLVSGLAGLGVAGLRRRETTPSSGARPD